MASSYIDIRRTTATERSGIFDWLNRLIDVSGSDSLLDIPIDCNFIEISYDGEKYHIEYNESGTIPNSDELGPNGLFSLIRDEQDKSDFLKFGDPTKSAFFTKSSSSYQTIMEHMDSFINDYRYKHILSIDHNLCSTGGSFVGTAIILYRDKKERKILTQKQNNGRK